MKKYVESFLEAIKTDGKSKCTIDAYRIDLNSFCEFFVDKDINLIRYAELREWVNSLESKGLSANTRARKISSVKSFFRYLLKMEIVDRNPADGLETPKIEKKQPVVISNNDASELLIHAKNYGGNEMLYFRDYTIIAVFLFTGIRREELINITLEDLDLSKDTILIHGKGNKQRTVYINETLHSILAEYINFYRNKIKTSKNSEFLFPSTNSKCICVRTVNNIVNKFFGSCGLKKEGVSAHILRKRFATSAFEATHDIATVSKLLGHSSPTVTERYIVINENYLRDVTCAVNF